MNWKLLVAVAVGMLIGLMASPRLSRTVKADALPSRFQVASATFDQENSAGLEVISHEAFLVDGDTGRVWRYQPTTVGETSPGHSVLTLEKFISVGIEDPAADKHQAAVR